LTVEESLLDNGLEIDVVALIGCLFILAGATYETFRVNDLVYDVDLNVGLIVT